MEDKNILLFGIILIVGVFVINSFSSTSDLTGRYDSEGGRGVMTCRDSDGFNIFMGGTVTTNTGGRIQQYNDRCEEAGEKVKEYFCRGNRYDFRDEWCPNGMICKNNKCEADTSSYSY